MSVYAFYLFDRHCECLFYVNYGSAGSANSVVESKATPSAKGSSGVAGFASALASALPSATGKERASSPLPPPVQTNVVTEASKKTIPWEEEAKLVYGVVFSLRNFANKLTPSSVTSRIGTSSSVDRFKSYATSQYRLHYFQTLSGLKMVLFTEVKMPMAVGQEILQQVYERVYVPYAAKNPLYKLGSSLMAHTPFKQRLDLLLRSIVA